MEKSTSIFIFSCLEMKPTFTATHATQLLLQCKLHANISPSIRFSGKGCSNFSQKRPNSKPSSAKNQHEVC